MAASRNPRGSIGPHPNAQFSSNHSSNRATVKWTYCPSTSVASRTRVPATRAVIASASAPPSLHTRTSVPPGACTFSGDRRSSARCSAKSATSTRPACGDVPLPTASIRTPANAVLSGWTTVWKDAVQRPARKARFTATRPITPASLYKTAASLRKRVATSEASTSTRVSEWPHPTLASHATAIKEKLNALVGHVLLRSRLARRVAGRIGTA